MAASAPVGRAGATALVAAPARLALLWAIDGAPDPLTLPTALAVGRQGCLYVVDAGNDRVQVFDGDGRSLARWGSPSGGDGQVRFRRPDRCEDPGGCLPDAGGAVAIDDRGRVYVADWANHRIQKFDGAGRAARPDRAGGRRRGDRLRRRPRQPPRPALPAAPACDRVAMAARSLRRPALASG